jgi:hypothetical protein
MNSSCAALCRQYNPKLDLEQRRQLALGGKALDVLELSGSIELQLPTVTDE